MKRSTSRTGICCTVGVIVWIAVACASLFAGRYPLTLQGLVSGDAMQLRVFWTLRFSRTAVGAAGGFALGVAGYAYQLVFRNPLASPEIIGVSSGAAAGAAAGILFFTGAAAATVLSFAGALLAMGLSLALSTLDRSGRSGTVVLAGVAVHSLAQMILMCLKLAADPERELASIEYWIMGSLNGVSGFSAGGNLLLCLMCTAVLFLLHRQLLLLSGDAGEARMLGVSAGRMRLAVLGIATLAVSCVISLCGLISFVGVLAPHGARILLRRNRPGTMLLSGILGGILLCGADILARCASSTELPVSIFTSMLGAPFLIWLIVRGRRNL